MACLAVESKRGFADSLGLANLSTRLACCSLQDDLAGVVAVAQGHEHGGRRSLPLVNGDVMTGIRLAPQTTLTPWHAVLIIVGTL